jgi:hypothetical protein
MRQIIAHQGCPDESIFFRLRGAGLVRRAADGLSILPRCKLYADFFQKYYG